jgi:hypothetical protein
MKKTTLLLLTALTALTGCGTHPSNAFSNGTGFWNQGLTTPAEGQVITPDSYGNAEGHILSTMHTYFFDFTISDAYLCGQYGDYTPEEGKELVAAQITVHNTSSLEIPMYDTDFQIQWGDPGEDAYEFPLTFQGISCTALGEDVLPEEYLLASGQSQTGTLVFEVPQGKENFSISYLEEFDDNTTGDVFFVYLHTDSECTEQHSGQLTNVDEDWILKHHPESDWSVGDYASISDSQLCLYEFTVEESYVCDAYENYVPEEGMELLAVRITVTNTSDKRITLFDTDFRIMLFGDDSIDYVFPLTHKQDPEEIFWEDVLPREYMLEAYESRTGLLIFEVPDNRPDRYMAHLSNWSQNGTGHVIHQFYSLAQTDM